MSDENAPIRRYKRRPPSRSRTDHFWMWRAADLLWTASIELPCECKGRDNEMCTRCAIEDLIASDECPIVARQQANQGGQ